MPTYITHQFAHCETLDKAERWLLQLGFQPGQIEVHRDGVPWISVLVSGDQWDEAQMVFEAAELNDPDGWPSFWQLAKMPHPHFDAPPLDATASAVVTARPSPVGWHPDDRAVAAEDDQGLTRFLDVSTRFS
jgi:hypothetical protein